MRRFLHSFYGLFLLSLLFAAVLLYPIFADAARESSRSSVRSASSRKSGAGTRQLGNRPESAGRSTFTKDDLTILCGRHFDKCAESYMPKKRQFKDPKCQELMPKCFKRFGPTSQQCQDTVYTCLDQICQPRGQCSDESRLKEIAVACLEKGDKYYPYVCSVRSFKSVVSQILTEAGGAALAMQAPTQTIVRNEISPELQARMDAQQAALEQQQAMLERQQMALEEAEAERERAAAEEEDTPPPSDDDPMWTEWDKCEEILTEAEGYLTEATEYAKCSPDVKTFPVQGGEEDAWDIDWEGEGSGDDADCESENVPRLKGLRYRLNIVLKSNKKAKSCLSGITKKAARAKMDSQYVKMLRKKIRYMNTGVVSKTIVGLNIGDFIKLESKKYTTKEDKIDIDTAVSDAVSNSKRLYEMNKIVLDDFGNMLSGVELDSSGSGKQACQGLSGQALDQCVLSTATNYSNEIDRRSRSTSSDYKKVRDLYRNSAYFLKDICDENGLGSSPSDKGTLSDCLQKMRQKANDNIRDAGRSRY